MKIVLPEKNLSPVRPEITERDCPMKLCAEYHDINFMSTGIQLDPAPNS